MKVEVAVLGSPSLIVLTVKPILNRFPFNPTAAHYVFFFTDTSKNITQTATKSFQKGDAAPPQFVKLFQLVVAVVVVVGGGGGGGGACVRACV